LKHEGTYLLDAIRIEFLSIIVKDLTFRTALDNTLLVA